MGYDAASGNGSQCQRVGTQHIVASWTQKKGAKWVEKPGQESCIYSRAIYDTWMSNDVFI